MGILAGILITFIVVVLVLYLVNMLPLNGRVKRIVRVIVIVIGVLSRSGSARFSKRGASKLRVS